MHNTITEEKLNQYLQITKEAIAAVKTHPIDEQQKKQAADLLDLAECYFSDAQHFKEKQEYVMAFTAVCYAHAFLDAGARLKLFKVNDSRLFMVDDK